MPKRDLTSSTARVRESLSTASIPFATTGLLAY